MSGAIRLPLSMSDIREYCDEKGLGTLECFEEYAEQAQAPVPYMQSSPEGRRQADETLKRIEEYQHKITHAKSENAGWHLFEEFRALS